MRQSQRDRLERQSKYHFNNARPKIFRIPQDALQHKKDCDCRVCKKYHAALIEAAAAFQKEELERQRQKQNENNTNNGVLNSNKATGPITNVSAEDVRTGEMQKAHEQRSDFSSDRSRVTENVNC